MPNFANKIFKALKGLNEEDGGIKTAIHNVGRGMLSAGSDADLSEQLAAGGARAGAGFLNKKLMKPANPIMDNIAVDAPMEMPEDDEAMRRRKAISAGMMTMNQGVG